VEGALMGQPSVFVSVTVVLLCLAAFLGLLAFR
jgi:hypothetical protein